jgi:hypothetical protein
VIARERPQSFSGVGLKELAAEDRRSGRDEVGVVVSLPPVGQHRGVLESGSDPMTAGHGSAIDRP